MSSSMGDNKVPDTVDEKQPLKEEGNGTIPGAGEELDSSKVKFINGGASADAVVDIDGQTKVNDDQEFVGLTKEELLKYADDPYWKKVRWILLILFWVAWVGMLVAAIVIIAVAPRCPPRPNLEWWQTSAVYQVQPKSFQDTNGDGVGDLNGIHKHLDYLRKQLNVTAVWVKPIYPSLQYDNGYDITDFMDVDPTMGTIEDFTNMRIAMHKKGIKLILEFIPNHVSFNHSWFRESKKNKNDDNAFRDYFIWDDGKPSGGARPDPPNNWLSVYGGSAWEWNEDRKQYYYHTYLPEQPDLNIRNSDVNEAVKEAVRFWLAKGVDGFYIDSAANLFESLNVTTDEPASGKGTAYKSLSHTLTTFQPESYEFVQELREIIDSAAAVDGKPKALIVGTYGTSNQSLSFMTYNGKEGAHLSLNMNLLNLKEGCDALCIQNLVQNWLVSLPEGGWSNWITGNHESSRVATRMGSRDWVNAVNMLMLTLPGTSITYYGEEIGMHDVEVPWERTVDAVAKIAGEAKYKNVSRDFQQTPMQWSGAENAGFSTANETWLPVAEDYPNNNVKAQLAHGAGYTNLEVYSKLTHIRQEPSFQWGKLDYIVVDQNILSYVRQAQGFKGYLVAINFGQNAATVDFYSGHSEFVPKDGIVAAHTANFALASRTGDYEEGNVADLSGVYLKPKEGVVFWWEAGAVQPAE